MNKTRNTAHMLVACLGIVGLGGCPAEPNEDCDGPDDPVLMLANRGGGTTELASGGPVEVFNAPQGGVFAELDVSIGNMGLSELEYLRVAVASVATGEQFAFARYFGNSVPLQCSEDQLLEMTNMPLGFVEAFVLQDLDEQAVVLTGVLETTAGEFTMEYDATLRAVDY